MQSSRLARGGLVVAVCDENAVPLTNPPHPLQAVDCLQGAWDVRSHPTGHGKLHIQTGKWWDPALLTNFQSVNYSGPQKPPIPFRLGW
jgi:hypothetical protein